MRPELNSLQVSTCWYARKSNIKHFRPEKPCKKHPESVWEKSYGCMDCRSEYHRKRHKDPKIRKKRNLWCKNYQRSRRENPKIRKKLNHYQRIRHIKNPIVLMLYSAKQRAKNKKIKFDVKIKDELLVLPTHCPILEIPIKIANGKPSSNSPSIDRIDVTKGYVVGNVRIISYLANTMKNSATLQQVKAFCRNAPKYLKAA